MAITWGPVCTRSGTLWLQALPQGGPVRLARGSPGVTRARSSHCRCGWPPPCSSCRRWRPPPGGAGDSGGRADTGTMSSSSPRPPPASCALWKDGTALSFDNVISENRNDQTISYMMKNYEVNIKFLNNESLFSNHSKKWQDFFLGN